MKCPCLIEPHQIQGLDFINVFPVIQWLVKRSVENRAEKAEKLKAFAIGQFHNHFSLKSDRDAKERYLNAADCIKEIQVGCVDSGWKFGILNQLYSVAGGLSTTTEV